jgi:cell division protein FtsW
MGPLTFQPSEVARLTLVIYLAYSLSKKQDALATFSVGLLPHLLILAVFSILLMMQPDFGSVVIFAILVLDDDVCRWRPAAPLDVGLRVAGAPGLFPDGECGLSHPAADQLSGSLATSGRSGISDDPFINGFRYRGTVGRGYRQELSEVVLSARAAHRFYFRRNRRGAGPVGGAPYSGAVRHDPVARLRIACGCQDRFGMLLATGITFALALQVSINMGVCLGLLPTKGLTLPFISYGGTSLLLNMAAIGILMNIGANHAKRT